MELLQTCLRAACHRVQTSDSIASEDVWNVDGREDILYHYSAEVE
jgi:hypothetical protein